MWRVIALLSLLVATPAISQTALFSGSSVAAPPVGLDVVCDLTTGVATGTGGGTCIANPVVCAGDLTSFVANVSITTNTAALSATTNVFSAGDVGKGILIPNAGSSGATYTGRITAFTNAQNVTVSPNAGTTVTASSKTITTGTSILVPLQQFVAWANTWQATHTGYIGLQFPSGGACQINIQSNVSANLFDGVKNMVVDGRGSSFTVFGPGIMFLGNEGLENNFGVMSHCALINTVSSGATQVTAVTAGQANRVTSGNYAMVMGLDMQGVPEADFGYPPNSAVFDFVLISGTNTGTGAIDFATTPITADYKSTWPKWGTDPGPAAICPLPANWNIDYEWKNLTFTQGAGDVGSKSDGRKVRFRDFTFTGFHGPTGSQNKEIYLTNVTCSSCVIEADKLVDLIQIEGGSFNKLYFQSSSIKRVVVDSPLMNIMDGNGKSFVGTNVTAASVLNTSISGYGNMDSFTCTNCVLGTSSLTSFVAAGVSETGLTGKLITQVYQKSGNVIKISNGRFITAMSSGTAGVFRLTLRCGTNTPTCTVPTDAFFENQWVDIANAGTAAVNGQRQVHIVDANNIELLGTTFNGVTTGGGRVWTGNPSRWAVPGAIVSWSTNSMAFGQLFRITDVGQDGNFINVTITGAGDTGGWPSYNGITVSGVKVHPAPEFTCTNCSGHLQVTDMAGATPGAPIFTYSKRTYLGSDMTAFSPAAGTLQKIYGDMVSATFNVTTPYSINASPMLSKPGKQNMFYDDNSLVIWEPLINLRTGGVRTVTPAGVTGAVAGDATLCDNGNVCTAAWNTGVVYPFAFLNGFNPNSQLIGNTVCVGQPAGCPVVDVEYIASTTLP